MFGCVLSQLKPSELYILSCEKNIGLSHSYECRAPRALCQGERTTLDRLVDPNVRSAQYIRIYESVVI